MDCAIEDIGHEEELTRICLGDGENNHTGELHDQDVVVLRTRSGRTEPTVIEPLVESLGAGPAMVSLALLALACSQHVHSMKRVQHRPYNSTIRQFGDFKSHSSHAGCIIQACPGIVDRRSTQWALVPRGRKGASIFSDWTPIYPYTYPPACYVSYWHGVVRIRALKRWWLVSSEKACGRWVF
jgi:hypothetical protein